MAAGKIVNITPTKVVTTRTRSKSKSRKTFLSNPQKKTVKKIAREVVASMAQNKVRQSGGSYGVRYMSDATNDLMIQHNLIPLSPYPAVGLSADETIEILQGTGSSTRNGNQIRTRKAVLRLVFTPLKYDSATNPLPAPMEVMIIIFKCKGIQGTGPDGDDLDGARYLLNNHCFQSNYSTQSSTGVDGRLITITRPFNNDTIQVLKKKVIKVGNSGISTSLSGDRTNQQQYVNNDFKLNQKLTFNVTKYLSKVYRYNDNDGETCNKNLFFFCCPFSADGYNLNNNGIIPLRMDWNYVYEYENY